MRAQFKTSPPLILRSTNCGLTNSCRKNEALRDKRVDKEAGENPSPASQCPVHHPAPFTGKLGPGSATQLVQKCNIQHFLVVRHWNVTSRPCAPGSLRKVLLKVLPIRRKMPGVRKHNAVEQRSLRIETVGSFLVTVLLIFSAAVPSAAQQTIKILPPINNSCTTFIGAMESGDPDKLAVLASWALGYVSGIRWAQALTYCAV